MADDVMMADESVPPNATAPGQSPPITALDRRDAGIRVVPVMFGRVVVVVDDVDVSAFADPGAACVGGGEAGRADGAEWEEDPDRQGGGGQEARTGRPG